jgi:CBS domain containing-hemolysin-like protein
VSTGASIILIIITVMLAAAAFFSGAETAIVSCSKVRLRSRARLGSWRARLLEKLLRAPEYFFSIVLVGTNLSVISCTALATGLAVRSFGDSGGAVATVIMTPILLIFGEVIPKSAFLYHADAVSIIIAPVLRVISIVLYPLVLPASLIARMMSRLAGSGESKLDILSSREELVYLYKRGKVEGELERREKRMIDGVFEFGTRRARDLMIPIESVVSFPVNASVDEVIKETNKHTYSRFPLVSPNDGSIVGIISLFDLLGLDGGERLATVMHEPLMVSEDESAQRLLLRLKDEPLHFAIVTSGERARGILTLENILESIVGDISNEYE